MEGWTLWIIGVMFTCGLLYKVYNNDFLKLAVMAFAALFVWPYLIAYLMFTKEKEGGKRRELD